MSIEQLHLAEKRQAFLDDVISILSMERNLLREKEEGNETGEMEQRFRGELTRCYEEYHGVLAGTPEASYLNRLMAYYHADLPENELQKNLDMTIDAFFAQHKLPTRAQNCIMNALYDARGRDYYLGELLALPEESVARRGCGPKTKSLQQIKDALAEEGLYLGMLVSYKHGKGYTLISSQKTS